MDYLPNADQTQIVDAFKAFLHSELPLSRLVDATNPQGDAASWQNLAELGWLSIAQDEVIDGAGLGAAEEMLLFIEAGKNLISPLLIASSLGARVLLDAGLADTARSLIDGTCRIAPAIARPGAGISDQRVNGEFYVLDAEHCDMLLVVTPSQSAVLPIDSASLTSQQCTDESLSLNSLHLADQAPLATSNGRVFEQALILCSAMLTGIAEQALSLAVSYANEREQFGKPIGAFQSIKHYCADMALRHEAALALTTQAALEFDSHHSEATFDALAAKLAAQKAAIENAEAAIQIHGAMGFTREMPIHLLLKRAHILSTLFADADALISNLTILPAPEL
ncbi:MAG: acyl-CoA dehydrogenase family protein [Pseudomonadota bacterium]|nr:acyl-CoA dehydrogenase family protein [Pseudomonadota bacterium]